MSDIFAAAVAKHGLAIRAEFIPFSKSRNAGEKDEKGAPRYSLNWLVTLTRNGRDIISTEYSAGMAHCPGYAATRAPTTSQPHDYKTHNGKPYPGTTSAYRAEKPHEALAQYRDAIAAAECESGFPMELDQFGRARVSFKRKPKAAAIEPKTLDVVSSLLLDSSVLDAGGFDEWASDLGYDTDSRKAESIYRACLEIALKVRNGLGESAMAELREAASDY